MWRAGTMVASFEGAIMPRGQKPVSIRILKDPHRSLNCMPDNASPVRQPAPPVSSTALEREVADLIVQALNLDVAAAEIAPEAPLYGEGLGLDSIDILEIALVVSKQYGIQLRADSEENGEIFRSLRQFARYVAAQRMK